jgi:hypothetical protein
MARKVDDTLLLERTPTLLWLTSPYKPAFIEGLRALGVGKWNPDLKQWHFPLDAEILLLALCQAHFDKYPVVMDVAEKAVPLPKPRPGRWVARADEIRIKPPVIEGDDGPIVLTETTPMQQCIKLARRMQPFLIGLSDEEKETIYDIIFNSQ